MQKANDKLAINFVVNASRFGIQFEAGDYISLRGNFGGWVGQIKDLLREAAADYPQVTALCDLWDKWHLKNDYPDSAVEAIKGAMENLRGKRFGSVPDIYDAPDCDGDVIDSRDVIKRIDIYRDALAAEGLDKKSETAKAQKAGMLDELKELQELLKLEDQASGSPDWIYGETLIRDSYFEDYAKNFAEDIGAIERNSRWPARHIDWKAAADALKQDYMSVEFRGETYWIFRG